MPEHALLGVWGLTVIAPIGTARGTLASSTPLD